MAADDLGLQFQMMTDSAQRMAVNVFSSGITLKHYNLGCQISICDQEQILHKALLQRAKRITLTDSQTVKSSVIVLRELKT